VEAGAEEGFAGFDGFLAVHLDGVEAGLAGDHQHEFDGGVDEDADAGDVGGEAVEEAAGLGGGDVAGAFLVEDGAEGAGAGVDAEEGVGAPGDAADFDVGEGHGVREREWSGMMECWENGMVEEWNDGKRVVGNLKTGNLGSSRQKSMASVESTGSFRPLTSDLWGLQGRPLPEEIGGGFRFDEGFADEEAAEAGVEGALDVVGGVDAAGGDDGGALGQEGGEAGGLGGVGVEMGEVAVVDADDGGGEVEDAAGVGFVVDFDEAFEADAEGEGVEGGQLVVVEDADDEEHGVGAHGGGFVDLVGVEDEVLAEDGELDDVAGALEVLGGAFEEGGFGEDGEGGGAAVLVGGGEVAGVQVGADVAEGGGGALDFGDDADAGAGEGSGEAAEVVALGGEAFELGLGLERAGGGDFGLLGGKDLIKKRHKNFRQDTGKRQDKTRKKSIKTGCKQISFRVFRVFRS
jgi:hypothetical protein